MAKPALSPFRIKSHLASRFGTVPDLLQMKEGEESQAFGFTSDGNEYIVRIGLSEAGFRKERFVFEHFASDRLPIPEIVWISALGDGLACCVSRRAAGLTLEDLGPVELLPLLAPIAEILDAMADCDMRQTDGFGPFDSSGTGSFGSWRDFLLAADDDRQYSWDAVTRHVDIERVGHLLARIRVLTAHCPEVCKLVHGDFGSNNVLVNRDRITGIIDWSEALFGDPIYDVANVLFWRPWLDCMEQQAHFFETRQPERLRDRKRLECYQLRIGVEVLYEAAMDANDVEAGWTLARCEAVVGESGR